MCIRDRERTVRELKNIGKPFVILLNSAKPYAQETVKLALEMEENYQTTVGAARMGRKATADSVKKEFQRFMAEK